MGLAKIKEAEKRRNFVVVVDETVVTQEKGGGRVLDQAVVTQLAEEISYVLDSTGYQVLLVLSGAAIGSDKQLQLMNHFNLAFKRVNSERNIHQILVSDRTPNKPKGAADPIDSTLKMLAQEPVVLIGKRVNSVYPEAIESAESGSAALAAKTAEPENSGVTLGAIIAEKVRAEILLLLGDTDGCYEDDPSKNPQAKVMSEILANDLNDGLIDKIANRSNDPNGMKAKLRVAYRVAAQGINTVIANGKKSEIVFNALINNNTVGTTIGGEV